MHSTNEIQICLFSLPSHTIPITDTCMDMWYQVVVLSQFVKWNFVLTIKLIKIIDAADKHELVLKQCIHS